MIVLSKTTADSAGQIRIRNYQLSGGYDNTARIARTKLLDGSGDLSHHGVSDTDRDLVVDCRLTPAEAAVVRSFFENAIALRISYWDGVYLGYIARLKTDRAGTTRLKFYFSEKLA